MAQPVTRSYLLQREFSYLRAFRAMPVSTTGKVGMASPSGCRVKRLLGRQSQEELLLYRVKHYNSGLLVISSVIRVHFACILWSKQALLDLGPMGASAPGTVSMVQLCSSHYYPSFAL